MNRTSQGLTLFEVGVALAVMVIAITSSLLVFPVGLKAQQQSRFRLYAAAHFQMLSGRLLEKDSSSSGSEGKNPQDRPYSNAAPFRCDVEAAGLMQPVLRPLPTTIARRLDSDNDAIARHVAEGGQLFYPGDGASDLIGFSNGEPISLGTIDATPLPAGSLMLVIGVRGYPQQNAMSYHPQIKWPYYDFHPSNKLKSPPAGGAVEAEDEVLDQAASGLSLPSNFVSFASSNDATKLVDALRYLGWDIDLQTTLTPSDADLEAEYMTSDLRFVARTLVLRYAAFALGKNARLNNGGFATGFPDGDLAIARYQTAQAWQQASLIWLQRYRPYDLRAPRDYACQLFTDFPLMQEDLTVPPLADPKAGTGILHAWKFLCSQPIRAFRSHSFPGPIASGQRQPGDGWNLTSRFDPSERCREVTYWAVDWQSYADFETAPAAAMPAGQLPYLPQSSIPGTNTWTAGSPGPVCNYYSRQNCPTELPDHWFDASRSVTVDTQEPTGNFTRFFCAGANKQNRIAAYLGRHGADRNGNHHLDVGPTDPSVRLRATTIARFLIYDPRGFPQDR